MIDVDGLPTLAGSHALDDEPLPADAPVVKRLRDAGALILGKTTTHEFASGITTPPTRNPWDPSRIPGGSSGGSGAAVAAGECLAALGTDSGGSIRVPSAFCGVSGLRPRLETVPPEGIIPLSWTHDTCGPIARSALDLALVWQIMADEPADRTDLPISEMTVGIPDPLQSVLEVEPSVEAGTTAAAKVLESQGARLTSVELPPFKEWDAPRKAVVVSDMLALHRESGWFPQRVSRYGEATAAFIRRGERITGADLAAAHRTLRALRRRFVGALDTVDVLVIPTTVRSAPRLTEAERIAPLGKRPPDSTFADNRPLVADVLRATGPISWCGLVSVTVPCGFSSEGLPIGVQMVARDESTALSAAIQYQSVTDFHQARPPIDHLSTS
jgi:aspartyl-tRNA(Asn)/glutamyl-tRNA(Gln) amidotransferase subunit A